VLPDLLASGQADLVLGDALDGYDGEVYRLAGEKGLTVKELRHDAYKIAVGSGHPLAESGSLSLDDVKDLPLACYSGGDPAAERYFEKFFSKALSIEYNSIEKIINATESNAAVSVLPETAVKCMRRSKQHHGNGHNGIRFLTVEGFCVPFIHYLGFRSADKDAPEIQAACDVIMRYYACL